MFCAGLVSIARYDTATHGIFQPITKLDASLARISADFRQLKLGDTAVYGYAVVLDEPSVCTWKMSGEEGEINR